ncbi:MAG: nucleotidyltransferase family protein [Candidatus Competibacteraceae bacterium]
MKRNEALAILRAEQEQLRHDFGVKSLALFGSVARDQAGNNSDVDLLVEFDRPIGLLHLIGTQQYIEKRLGVARVDLILRRAVLPELKENILAEAVDAF